MRISREKLQDTGCDVIKLIHQYKRRADRRERKADGVLFGLLEGRFGKIERQAAVRIGRMGSIKWIDFKQQHARPVYIEFAVATSSRASLYGPVNRSELIKLERMPSRASRFLLLLDMAMNDPLSKAVLQESYDRVRGGKGNYRRSVVNVIYCHADRRKCFWFRWWPA